MLGFRCVKKIPLILGFTLLCLFLPLPFSHAQETFTGQYSTVVLILAPAEKMPKLRVYLEGQLRLQSREGQSAFERSLLWAGLGYAVTPKTTLFAGHGWTPNYNPEFINEQRSFQQVLHIEKVRGGLLFLRGRLEERFIPDASAPLVWTRGMVQYQRDFTQKHKMFWIVRNEVIFNANTISKANQQGLSQILAYAGIGRHLSKHLSAEIGYMALYLNSRNDSLEHILMLNVLYLP